MGTISHDSILVTGRMEHVQKAHDAIAYIARRFHPEDDLTNTDWSVLVSPVIPHVMNRTASMLVASDGSKEWWSTSDQGDELRSQIVGKLRDLDAEGCYVDIVLVRHGELGEAIEVIR